MTMILGALAIGITLGLLGSGGSILTVPVLVYVLGHNDKVAIAESLAIVGGISLVGMLPYARSHLVDWKHVWFFGVPGMVGTWLGAWLAKFVSGPAQLVLFAVVMLLAAGLMVRRPKAADQSEDAEGQRHPVWQIILEGLGVGVLTGLVGVGGGFLIVPALVILGGLPMRLAVGTSLRGIAMNTLSGLFKYLGVLSYLGTTVDCRTISIFLLVGIVGTLTGNVLNQRINQTALRRVFAVFLVIMGCFVLGRELPRLMQPANISTTQTTRLSRSTADALQLANVGFASQVTQ